MSREFFRQEYWSGLPFPLPGDLPDPEVEPASLALPALAGKFLTTVPPGRPSSNTHTDEGLVRPLEGTLLHGPRLEKNWSFLTLVCKKRTLIKQKKNGYRVGRMQNRPLNKR